MAADEGELVVTMTFDAADAERLRALVARYIVVSRRHPGCRDVDLLVSATRPRRHLLITKWASPTAQRAHFDSPDMVELAEGCRSILTAPPAIDLFDAISAHDLNR